VEFPWSLRSGDATAPLRSRRSVKKSDSPRRHSAKQSPEGATRCVRGAVGMIARILGPEREQRRDFSAAVALPGMRVRTERICQVSGLSRAYAFLLRAHATVFSRLVCACVRRCSGGGRRLCFRFRKARSTSPNCDPLGGFSTPFMLPNRQSPLARRVEVPPQMMCCTKVRRDNQD
jgi:hypothetical protein